MSDGAA